MDEKEIDNIRIRARKQFALVNSIQGYLQGALDQDPISRKKRTEEIITIILNTHTKLINDFPSEKFTPYVEGLINKMLAEVQVLP